MNRSQGFTLLELLVVIAIIGIVAMVMIPNFIGAQKRAFDTESVGCASSLSRAISSYRIDHPLKNQNPTLSQLYGTPDINREYGTNTCNDIQVIDASTATELKFTAKHPEGTNTYIITNNGVQIAP